MGFGAWDLEFAAQRSLWRRYVLSRRGWPRIGQTHRNHRHSLGIDDFLNSGVACYRQLLLDGFGIAAKMLQIRDRAARSDNSDAISRRRS